MIEYYWETLHSLSRCQGVLVLVDASQYNKNIFDIPKKVPTMYMLPAICIIQCSIQYLGNIQYLLLFMSSELKKGKHNFCNWALNIIMLIVLSYKGRILDLMWQMFWGIRKRIKKRRKFPFRLHYLRC